MDTHMQSQQIGSVLIVTSRYHCSFHHLNIPVRPNKSKKMAKLSQRTNSKHLFSILYLYYDQNKTFRIIISLLVKSVLNMKFLPEAFLEVFNFYPVRIILHKTLKVMLCPHSSDNRLTTAIFAEFYSLSIP